MYKKPHIYVEVSAADCENHMGSKSRFELEEYIHYMERSLNWFGVRLVAGVTIAAAAGLFYSVFGVLTQDVGNKLYAVVWLASLSTCMGALLGGPIACIVLCTVLRNVNPWRVWTLLSLSAGFGIIATEKLRLPDAWPMLWVIAGPTLTGTCTALLIKCYLQWKPVRNT